MKAGLITAIFAALLSGCAMAAYKPGPQCARMEAACKAYDAHPWKRRRPVADTVLVLKKECAGAELLCREERYEAGRDSTAPPSRRDLY